MHGTERAVGWRSWSPAFTGPQTEIEPDKVEQARILLVEDDARPDHWIVETLSRTRLGAVTVTTGTEALQFAGAADLILLDLGLSGGDWHELSTMLSQKAPLIVLGNGDGDVDAVIALELGADDYLKKPVGDRELIARCRSVLRRSARVRGIVRVGDLEIDVGRLEARKRGCGVIALTTKERQLLVALARHDGSVVRRAQLAEELWGSSSQLNNRALDVHISALRRKLGDNSRDPRYIGTVHGLGFRLLV